MRRHHPDNPQTDIEQNQWHWLQWPSRPMGMARTLTQWNKIPMCDYSLLPCREPTNNALTTTWHQQYQGLWWWGIHEPDPHTQFFTDLKRSITDNLELQDMIKAMHYEDPAHPPKVDCSIPIKQLQKGFRNASKSTSSSPTGLHYGHWKSLLHDDDLFQPCGLMIIFAGKFRVLQQNGRKLYNW